MKFLPLLAFISAPAFAQDQDATTADLCKAIGEVSAEIIHNYYVGVPLDEMMAIAGDTELLVEITLDAYDEPRFSTDEVIAEATFDFRNKWEHGCFQAFNNQ